MLIAVYGENHRKQVQYVGEMHSSWMLRQMVCTS